MRLGLLAGNEALKALRRRAFWITTLALAGLVTMIHGGEWWRASESETTFSLPDAWAGILSNTGPIPALFSAVLVILLIGSEFTWKTARQNVIDGLSRDEFFMGKLFVLAVVPVLLTAVNIAIGGVFAGLGGIDGAVVTAADLAQMAGALTMSVGLSSLAFLAVFAVRSNGAAMGLFFLWFAILEQIISGVLVQFGDGWQSVARWLPGQLFSGLTRRGQWDLERRAATAERLAAEGRPPPEYVDSALLVGGSALWVVVLVALAWWLYRRKDL